MPRAQLGSILGGHLSQMGLKLEEDTKVYRYEEDIDVFVERRLILENGVTLTYVRRYYPVDKIEKFRDGRVPRNSTLHAEFLGIEKRECGELLTGFDYLLYAKQNIGSSAYTPLVDNTPKAAVRQAMQLLH